MAKIFINQLQACAIIGIFDWERKIKQTIVIDLELTYDASGAADTDDITHALDYKELTVTVVQHIQSSQFNLIEALAESVCHLILQNFQVDVVKIALSKPGALRNAASVGIILEKSR